MEDYRPATMSMTALELARQKVRPLLAVRLRAGLERDAQPALHGHVAFRERRPGVVQLMAPLFHEDGDGVDLFLDEKASEAGEDPGGRPRNDADAALLPP
jgi:hypothetical protein